MIEWITLNYQWLFGGLGATAFGLVITYFFLNGEKNKVNKNSVNINNNINQSTILNSELTIEESHKSLTRILFIDDNHKEYKMVSILKKYGWTNTKSVKDITDLDDPIVLESDIIFVDINGVGTTLFQDQGLGLASALKKKYPNKKIIIYSSEIKGDRFHRALREVDDCLYKDAEPYQFINLIENFSKK
jgi:hypothetical protein